MSRSGRPQAVLSRRALLAAACGLPVLAACTKQQEFPHAGPDVVVREGLLTTRHWPGHRPHWIVMRPRGVARPPVIVSLHGKNADAWSTFHALGAQRYIPSTGVAVAAIDGGNYYWHARRSESTGADDVSTDTPPCDTGAMVVDDFVPLLGRLGLEVSRVAMMGWSMGGYGALLLSAQLGSSRVAGVAPMSAALWTEPGASAAGAFDDAEDWEHNNVFADRARFAGIPIRLACGTADPFYQADQAFVRGFASLPRFDVDGIFDPGGHDNAFWSAHVGAQIRFLAALLGR